MTKNGQTALFRKDNSLTNESKNLLVVLEIKSKEGRKGDLLKDVQEMADHVKENEPSTGTFWALEYLPEYSDNGLVIFSKFENSNEYQKHMDSPKVNEIRFVELF